MMRTFSSGVLGLQTHQTQMDVISNNIANVNNYGYKKGRVIFKDILSQTIANGQAPIGNLGGINPMEVGLGVKIGSIDNVFTQGALQNTGRELDVAIQGEGFLVTTNGTSQYYTRTGTLDLDSASNLVHSGSSTKIMGWTAKEDDTTHALTINTSDKLSTINFAEYTKLPAASTSIVEFASNLQNSAAERNLPEERQMVYYDDTGAQQTLKIKFAKLDKSNWFWTAIDDTQGQVGTGKLTFDENGKITTSTGGPVLTFDPDGATGTPPTSTLQANNSANIEGATLKSLESSTWASAYPLSKNGVAVTDMTTKLSELYDNTNADAGAQFDLRNLDGDESLVVSGIDGNGLAIAEKTLPIGPDMTLATLMENLKTFFPNAVPTYNSTTGKIQLTDASPGTKDILRDIKINFVNPNNAAKAATFPGVTTTTTSTPAQAGGFAQLTAASGTVQSGVHSITVTKIAATSSNITGVKTGLSRFTTFADLDIGDVTNFKISIDSQTPVQLSGLSSGNYGTLTGANAISAPPAGGYVAGSIIINGNLVSWDTADVSGLTQGQMGNFVANKINTLFRTVETTDPTNPNIAYSTFDTVTNKLSIQQTHRGATYKVNIQNADAILGFSSTQSVAYGTDGSTVSDFIEAINSQIGGVTAEMQGDRVVVKRSITGSAANISIIPTVPGSATTYPAATAAMTDAPTAFSSSTYTINDSILGTSTPTTVLGSEQSFNMLDVFTPAAGGASVELKYNNVKDGQIIGNANIGEIILNSSNFQSGTATITTTNERNANNIKINVP
ncbi:MAG TPA: flagellar hook-basal body complex protein, partial [Candidatus Wallbacteria bacterium]|nr:flagellar hook-basal body complex protein [Candidatus Wallbacteria bacterium]